MDNNGNAIQWSNQCVNGFWRELKTNNRKEKFQLKRLKDLSIRGVSKNY